VIRPARLTTAPVPRMRRVADRLQAFRRGRDWRQRAADHPAGITRFTRSRHQIAFGVCPLRAAVGTRLALSVATESRSGRMMLQERSKLARRICQESKMPRTYIAFALLALGLSATTARAADTQAYFNLHDLGHGVWAAISPPKSKAGANAGFVIGPDGVLVIDTFEDPAAAKAMLAAIRTKTRAPIRYVIDTHYHLDHTAGNDVFAAAGATVMAQRNVRTWERSQNLKFFGAHPTAKQKRMVGALGLPPLTYEDGVTIWLGNRKILVRTLEGHTGGDSTVIVPDAKVVFTGDLFWNHTLPNLIDANTREQIASNDTYLHDYPDATFVPGHGDIGRSADVREFRDYLATLRQAVAGARTAGKSGEALVDDVLPSLERKYGRWNWFKYFARHNVEQTAAELQGTKRVPVPGVP